MEIMLFSFFELLRVITLRGHQKKVKEFVVRSC